MMSRGYETCDNCKEFVAFERTYDGGWKCPSCGDEFAICGEEEDVEEDDGETLNVCDAADIYASSGFDEDYQFGYTHEELMEALG